MFKGYGVGMPKSERYFLQSHKQSQQKESALTFSTSSLLSSSSNINIVGNNTTPNVNLLQTPGRFSHYTSMSALSDQRPPTAIFSPRSQFIGSIPGGFMSPIRLDPSATMSGYNNAPDSALSLKRQSTSTPLHYIPFLQSASNNKNNLKAPSTSKLDSELNKLRAEVEKLKKKP